MKRTTKNYQANQYDKIFKENIEAVIPSLMHNILNIHVVDSEELPDDIQHTKERKPDVLKKITDDEGNIFVLHIEFQVVDDPEMVYRMAEYYVMLERKYQLPVEQFVIFLGASKPKMTTQINSKHMKYDFNLISFAALDYRIFLNSDKPEEVILGILANFQQEDPENALKQIIHRIRETTKGDLSLSRYFNQLRVLSQLRNLDLKLQNAMESIAKYISEERDVLYLRGEAKGEARGETKAKEALVFNLLTQTDFGLEKIANLANVTVEFVKQIQEKILGDTRR